MRAVFRPIAPDYHRLSGQEIVSCEESPSYLPWGMARVYNVVLANGSRITAYREELRYEAGEG